jgi:integrase
MDFLDLKQPQNYLLHERLKEYVHEATSPATRKAYQADLKHFQAWGGKIPCPPQILADYLVSYAGQLSIATLQRRLASISKAHTTQGLPSPVSNDLVQMTMKGIRRKHGKPQRQAKPLMKEDLLHILAGLGSSTIDIRDRALLLIGFAGAFRRSELVAINCTDLEFVREGLIITLPRSKTDQEGKGRKVGIPYAKGSVCPVKSLQEWMTHADITADHVFRPISKHGNIEPSKLSTNAVSEIIKKHVQNIGLDPQHYSGHSLRAGFVTTCAALGANSYDISQQTGHKSETTLKKYNRPSSLLSHSILKRLF